MWKTLWNKIQGQNVKLIPEKRVAFSAPPLGDNPDLEDVCYQAHMDILAFPYFQWYMEMRGLQSRVEVNEIGYRQGWYTFPVVDRDYKFQTAVFRASPHVQEVSGVRYWCKSTPHMYVPDWKLVLESDVLYVVYGILDALTLSDLRLPVVTSTAGNNTFNADWLDEFRRRIYIIPDKKEESQALQLMRDIGSRSRMIRMDFPDGKKDVNGYYEVGKGKELWQEIKRKSM
jgi:hypothetical protein